MQRLDTAFSRALLDGKAGVVVDPKVLESALQQQLIHGGTLDTLLIELGVIDEAGAQRALSSSSGTTPVDAAALEDPDPEATRLLPERLATMLGTAPFARDDDGTLHVAMRGPLDQALVDEVAGLLKIKVVPHVVPEVRVCQALHKGYGTPIEGRFLALLRTLQPTSTASSTVPGPAATGTADDPVVAWDLVEAMAHLAAQESRDGIAEVATSYARRFLPFAAVFGVRKDACVGWHRQGPAEGALFSSKPFAIPADCVLHTLVTGASAQASPYLGKPPLTEGNAAFFGWLGRRRPKSVLLVPIVVAKRPVACLYADGGIRSRGPGDLGELTAFAARLGPAFEALLRQRHREHPSLFPRSTSEAVDPTSLEPPPLPRLDSALTTLAMPPPTSMPPETLTPPTQNPTTTLEPSSAAVPPPPLETTATTTAPTTTAPTTMPAVAETGRRDGTSPFARQYVPPLKPATKSEATPADGEGDVVTETPIVLSGMGALLLDERLAARLHQQDASRKSTLFAVDDAVAPAVWQGALHDTVEKGLQGGATDDKPLAFGATSTSGTEEDDGWESVVYDPAHAKDLEGAPSGAPRADRIDLSFPELSTSTLAGLYGEEGDDDDDAPPKTLPTSKDPPLSTLSHRDLVELLFAADDDLITRASRELVSRGLAAVPALSERFPGRLRVDPFDPGENVRSADRTGPIVDVLARLGPDGLDAAIPHVDSKHPAHRFAAVMLFALSPDVRAIDLLRARLHDQEPRIRELAAEAMMPFLAHPRFEALLVHLRERTSTTKPLPIESRRRAIELLGQFRDVGAVPLLIALLNSGDVNLAEETRKALRAIALQDFGNRAKPWERWWAKAKKRSRLDWLIDALSSEELDLRKDAHRELASLAGDDFGYRPDADKRSRQRAIEVWQQWWTDEKARAHHPAAVART